MTPHVHPVESVCLFLPNVLTSVALRQPLVQPELAAQDEHAPLFNGLTHDMELHKWMAAMSWF